ncbi:putative helicase mov-10-B.2 [Labrus mixtus]|uniref:putative helicase mov-10-B.2 n=1 Tax=Labrus mixtus TaxID=508554 RepID=UPI0029C0C359|nr:putative helicase mov-10-B.2 [Labrus mixtus]
MSTSDCLRSGVDFIEFLGDRKFNSRSKQDLRDIYNLEFKPRLTRNKRVTLAGVGPSCVQSNYTTLCVSFDREGIRDPEFSKVLDALVKAKKVYLKQGLVYIDVKPEVRRYCPQWRRTRDPQPPHSLGLGPNKTDETPAASSSPSSPLNPVLTTEDNLKKILNKLKVNREELTADKGGIQITSDPAASGGKVTFTVDRLGESFTVTFKILNKGTNYVNFTFYTALHKTHCFTLRDERKVTRACPVFLCPERFGNLTRSVGRPPKMAVRLREYRCPPHLKELAKRRMKYTKNLSYDARSRLPSVTHLLTSGLNTKTYSRLFHLLLHLEEITMEVDSRKYDLSDQTMTQDKSNKQQFKLCVPGVAENPPSVLKGDIIMVSNSDDTVQPSTKYYYGKVFKVELDSVILDFPKWFLLIFRSDMKFNVEFPFNRLTLQLQHRAVDLADQHHLKKVLFPSGAAAAECFLPKLRMFNRQLENNPQQSSAVQHIVAGSSKPAPYLVFGPPGTGKTITLVEAMNQVRKKDSSAHILACAPSNNACDLLCERLMVHMAHHQVYRLYAKNHDPRTIPEQLRKHCNWDPAQHDYMFPDASFLMNFRVIVTTMFTAGRLVSKGVPVGHFTHVFLDEAGQAEEPQCIIAVAGLLSAKTGQLVLAGDPKQLGPMIRSRLALNHGLGISLLERLMTQNDLYKIDSGQFDPRFMIKLLRNYRSHPDILKIPNEKFYDNELQAYADRSEREAYCRCDTFTEKGFPVIYHGVMGKDQREGNSQSFFNESEINTLKDYLHKLIDTQGKNGLPKVSAKDIGIIAPYRKQVEKIRKALKSDSNLRELGDLTELKVGCVEEFQGQERKIIMVSTVRSSNSYVKMDQNYNIGFLANNKRFNVAITRAKSLLIVVGNPVIFSKEPTWSGFIDFCVKNGGYRGCVFKKPDGEADLSAKLLSLKIHVDSEHPVSEESALEQKDEL